MTTDVQQLARDLAAAATEAIRPHFRSHATGIDRKADDSPVTIADRAAESAMRAILAERAPDDGIYGEEFGQENLDARRIWVLDPLDGTRAFASGFPIFGTLIALLEDGTPRFGLCEMNITTEQFWGDGAQTYGPHGALTTSSCDTLAGARLRFTSHEMFDAAELAAVTRLSAECQFTHLGGDCYNSCLLAGGHCELIAESGLEPYDYMALIPIVEGAGGVISDWRGNALTLHSAGQILVSANRALHNKALPYLNALSKD